MQDYLQLEAKELLPWTAMSPNMNRIEHLWDSRTESERTYPKVSKHSGIRDCFGTEMATVTVPSTQTETLGSRNEETCSGTVQDARRLYLLLTLS